MCGWRANRNVLETFGHVGLGQQVSAMHSIDGRDFVLLVSNGLASSVLLVNATNGQGSTLLAESLGVTVSDVRRFLSPGNFQQTAVNFLDANGRGQIGRLVQGGVVPMTSGDGEHRALGAWSVSDFGFGAGALFTLSDSQNGTGIHLGRTHRNGGNYEFLTAGNAMTLRGALLASPTSRGELVSMTAEMPPGSPSQVFRWHGTADVRVEPIDPTVAPGSRLEIEFFAAPGELGTVLLASDFATPITVAGFGGTLHLSLTPPPLVLSSGIGGNDPRVPLSFPFQLPNDPQLQGLRVALQSARVTATQRRFGRHSYLSVF
jgi:hypothetical protein